MTQTKILAAIGHLPKDTAVIERAVAVAMASGAELQVIHVLDLPGDATDLKDITTFLGQVAFAARDRIELALTEVGAESSRVEIKIALGSPAIAQSNICSDVSPELIVMRGGRRISDQVLSFSD